MLKGLFLWPQNSRIGIFAPTLIFKAKKSTATLARYEIGYTNSIEICIPFSCYILQNLPHETDIYRKYLLFYCCEKESLCVIFLKSKKTLTYRQKTHAA